MEKLFQFGKNINSKSSRLSILRNLTYRAPTNWAEISVSVRTESSGDGERVHSIYKFTLKHEFSTIVTKSIMLPKNSNSNSREAYHLNNSRTNLKQFPNIFLPLNFSIQPRGSLIQTYRLSGQLRGGTCKVYLSTGSSSCKNHVTLPVCNERIC